MIRHKYQFINYNGLRTERYKTLTNDYKTNIFGGHHLDSENIYPAKYVGDGIYYGNRVLHHNFRSQNKTADKRFKWKNSNQQWK